MPIAYEPVAPHSEKVLAICPFGRVPAFRDGDFTLYETTAIVRYIDECFAGPVAYCHQPLGTRQDGTVREPDQLSRSTTPMIRRYVLQYVFPKGAGGAPDRGVIDKVLPEIKSYLDVLDLAYGPRDVLAGAAVTMADLLLAPIIFYLPLFPEGKALLAGAPNVVRAHAAMADRESFKATAPKLG